MVDEVEDVRLPISGLVGQAHRLGLDGDPSLLLQIHVVEQTVGALPLTNSLGQFQQPIGQRGLAVVDVGDDGKISDELGVYGLARHKAFFNIGRASF